MGCGSESDPPEQVKNKPSEQVEDMPPAEENKPPEQVETPKPTEQVEESSLSEEAELEAIAAIEKLGGTVSRSEGHVSYVNFYEVKVADAGLEHLKGMTTLRGLNLAYTKITDAGLVHLKGLTNLDDLYPILLIQQNVCVIFHIQLYPLYLQHCLFSNHHLL